MRLNLSHSFRFESNIIHRHNSLKTVIFQSLDYPSCKPDPAFIIINRLIPLTTTTKSCGCDLTFIATNIMCRNWSDIHRLLDEAVEQQSTRSGCSSIKTKHKFVQIIVQIRGSWRTLMSSLQPTLQQGDNSVSQRQQILTNISCFANNRMLIPRIRQLTITIPIIGK